MLFFHRNLFFRISYLLQNEIIPIFVLEGETPTLKYNVVAKRNEMQFCGAKPREPSNKEAGTKDASKGRTRFNHVLKQCADLIDSMGLKCVQAPGEAEAYCSILNRDGVMYTFNTIYSSNTLLFSFSMLMEF